MKTEGGHIRGVSVVWLENFTSLPVGKGGGLRDVPRGIVSLIVYQGL